MSITYRSAATSLVAVLMTVTGCRTAQNGAAADSSTTPHMRSVAGTRTDSANGGIAAMPGVTAMPGMAATMGGNGMMDSMQTHMGAFMAANTNQMKTMLPLHRQMVGNMIVRMNQDMRGMNVPTNAAWTSTMDSLQQDLLRQPKMSAGDLAASLPAHQARIRRLIQMHRDMMGKGKP